MSAQAEPPPAQLGQFEILRRLGAGGMAEVFLAKKRGAEGTFKLLVLKRILPTHGASRRFRSMFAEEAHLATRLNHPNIVHIYEFFDHGDDGQLLSMEYVEGPDLGKLMAAAKQRGVRLPPWVSAFVIAEAARGLHYAHERRDEGGAPLEIVHRDVSPQNILLSFDGVVKIADFGIASANLFREEVGVLKGKYGYMSPEQARGEKVDRRSDVYGLGVVFYEMLALRSPYGSLANDDLLAAVRAGSFEPPSAHAPDVPPELESIVMRALSPGREERFQTARDMAGAVARALLARQELVDGSSVEATIRHVLGRDGGAELAAEGEGSQLVPPRTLAAVPLARSVAGEEQAARKVVHEVRHVAVVTLRIQGFEELETAKGKLAARRALDQIRHTLDDVAYKHGALWSWSKTSARAVTGLLANPARAAADSALLAIDVHEALAGFSEDLPVELRAAIGIVRGIASGERDDQGHLVHHQLKPPANFLADLLSERAPFGKTWVAGGLYRLVRREFRWGDAPALDIPDADQHRVPPRMRLYALQRQLTREERAAELELTPNDLVGRDAERAELHAAHHRAARVEGSVRVVPRVVVGEMGIGKSALVATFLSELRENTRVVRVECSPVRSELPFGALGDLVREAAGLAADASGDDATLAIRELLAATPAALRHDPERLATVLAALATGRHFAHGDDDDPAYRTDLLVAAVGSLLSGAARDEPLVLVVDGLQWADRPSLELLTELLRRVEGVALVALLVTRPDERVAPFLEGLVRIELRGLSAEEQVRLVEARLGVREGVAAVCGELLPRVAGNPFFLLEMVDALLEKGALEIVEIAPGEHALRRIERASDRAETLPSTLEQIIGDRIRELPGPEHDVIDWLAVAQGPLALADLLALTRLPDDEPIMRLCARGMCERRGELIDFRHPLARDVTYLALDAASRVRMHRRLGEHLSTTPLATGLSAAIVARHLARGEAPAPAADLYLEAAGAARASHQARLAARYYRTALDLLPALDSRRIGAHEALEAIHRHLGQRRARRRHLSELRRMARESGQARWVALALVRTARFEYEEGHLARGLPVAQRAAEVSRAARSPVLEVEALGVLSELLRDLGDVQGALAACEHALRVTESHELPPRVRAEVLRTKGVLLRRVGRVREAVLAHADAIAAFRAVGARRQEARAKNALAFAMFVLERFEDAIAMALASLQIDLAIGGRFQIAKTLSNIGQAYARLGDLSRGLAFLKRARDAHERYDDLDSRADTLLVTSGVLIEAGDLDAAHTFCGDAGALVAVTGSVYDRCLDRLTRALLARAAGDAPSAMASAADARQVAETHAMPSYHVYAMAIEAAARVDAGEAPSGVLLAQMALAAIEGMPSEYGLEVRSLCAEALLRAGSTQRGDAYARAAAHVRRVASSVRDPRLHDLFLARPVVRRVLAEAERLRAESAAG